MALGGLNRDGPASTLADMQQAARPDWDGDDNSLPARVARHDGILADHGVALDARAHLLGDHDARIAALEGASLDGADALDQLGDQVLDGAQRKAEARRLEARRLGVAARRNLTGHEALIMCEARGIGGRRAWPRYRSLISSNWVSHEPSATAHAEADRQPVSASISSAAASRTCFPCRSKDH